MSFQRSIGVFAVSLAASCGTEEIELVVDLDAAECMVCEAPDSCVPAPDGTACATGTCVDGVCVGIGCDSGERFVGVAAGENHTCALGFTGTLYCWGKNADGQLGLGDQLQRLEPTPVGGEGDWEMVAAGWKHTCGQRRDSTSWCWGRNGEGELGVGDQVSPRTEPTAIANGDGPWSQMDLGNGHSCALEDDGDLWCWGKNGAGELGLGDVDNRVVAAQLQEPAVLWRQVSAGAHHTCAVDWDGALWCWGDNADGRLGLADETDRATPARVAEQTSWAQVSGGGAHTCAIDSSGAVLCWGRNVDGEAGVGPDGVDAILEPTPAESQHRWAHLGLGDRHSCAVAKDGSLWCWGRNDKGQLGLGDAEARTAPEQVGAATDWSHVAGGKRHTCGLRLSGALFCWGLNDSGQLGLDDLADRAVPTQVCPPGGVE